MYIDGFVTNTRRKSKRQHFQSIIDGSGDQCIARRRQINAIGQILDSIITQLFHLASMEHRDAFQMIGCHCNDLCRF